ncbi:MFS transporter [Paenibacillus methanolicus]|uniref:Putative MFS family arabinose efflux permease n=1 Tax=Paenibacillus methanolicus TaxID=582686 RepID=A0A5S5CEK9_9BACL|nr:MFS transporter [Paenibacillus methanolicus]TYP77569.1 putative MFS family arabinose efflux permease [Paenibacillus methanolicus]
MHDPLSRPDDHPAIAANRMDHLVFIVVTLLYWSTLYVYVPILSPFLSERGYSGTLIGIVLGSYGFTQLLIRFPLGLYSDKLHKRKPFLLLGMISGALSCLLFMMPGSWVWPLAGRIISGVSASVWAAFTVLYAAYFRSSESTKAMSNISFMTAAGQLIGMILSGQLAGARGWNAAFAAGIGFGVIGLVIALLVKEPKEGVERAPISLRMLRSVVRTRLLIQVSVLSILAHCVLFITMFGFTPLHATTLGATKSELTWIVIAFMVPHAFTTFVTGRYLAPKFGIWNVIAAGFALSAVFTLAIPLSGSLGMLAVTQAFNGIAQGLHLPLFMALAITPFETEKRATAMGFYQAVYSAGMFAGPFVAGFMNERYGLASGFWLGGGIALFSMLLAVRWRSTSSSVAGQRTLSG